MDSVKAESTIFNMKTNFRIKERVDNSRIITTGSKVQGYINIGVKQISWVTAKIPEFGWTVVLIERFFTVNLSNTWIGAFTLGTVFGLFGLGFIWRKSGMYGKQEEEQAKQNPVSDKMLKAAEIIIKNDSE